ncbi:MAG: right-handed parallel beta-helix repeat-containing protein [Candidatus Thermoplasmatota archaeon]|nr:right-handed parallel beta-helix repeat-containing protein [Candidatus Thermoplasmatota archaeon]
MVERGKGAMLLISVLLLASFTPLVPNPLPFVENSSTEGRATTTWSGTMTLSNDYTVAAGDTLIIDAGATISFDDNVRLYVEGELDVTGTSSSPAIITRSSNAIAHEGIQFNASSRGRGSVIDFLVMEHAEWGITIYNSNPTLNDVYIENPDYVGVDIFDNANPTIQRLTIQDGGQDVASTSVNNRYGIGLSIGASSNPLVLGATFDNLTTRGVNMWGDSSGFLRDLTISNISAIGTGGWLSAGIWVEDSVALFDNVSIDRSDNGIWVQHISETVSTRPTFWDTTVTHSMYRGVYVEQFNHSNFNAPLNAIFDNLEVSGSGQIGSKTPGLCYHAIGVNTSGIDLRNSRALNNDCNGFKGYMIDSATIIDNLTLDGNGASAAISRNDQAGLFLRSVNWAPQIRNVSVNGSMVDGIFLSKANLQGHNWASSNNNGHGLYIDESHPDVAGISLTGNGQNGLRVYDASNVELYDLDSSNNGGQAVIPSDGVGLYFEKSNDLMSGTKNVSCTRCSSTNDAWGGILIKNSVDLQLHDLVVNDPGNSALAVEVDNGDMNFNGWIDIHGLEVQANRTGPIVQLTDTEARISSVRLNGSHSGLAWDGSDDPLTSTLSDVVLSGPNCLEMTDLHLVVAASVDVSACTGQINLRDTTVNMSKSIQGSSVTFDMTGQPSTLRWIDSSDLGLLNVGVGSIVDEMWTMHIWATNQHNHGLPNAVVNLSFNQAESSQTHTMPYSGNVVIGPFSAQQTDWMGSGAWTEYWIGCEYDGVRADSATSEPIPVNRVPNFTSPVVICEITLSNQAPLIIWDTPLDEEVFGSGAVVEFNANESWDLDDDPISYTWTSNIDGDLHLACTQGVGPGDNKSHLVVNDNTNNAGCLSDGIHQITLEVCDDQGNCANESREIELRNLPPLIDITTDPGVDMDGALRLFRTGELHINMSGTTDPEGDSILCGIDVSYRSDDGAIEPCAMEWNATFLDASDSMTSFTYTITVTDGVNTPVDLIYQIELINELPHPQFTINRLGNTSAFTVQLDSFGSYDPEGDPIVYRWSSDLLGVLFDDGDGVWTGRLPAGTHQITLSLSDDRVEHLDVWSTHTETLIVENTPSTAMISSHADFSTDSSVLHQFESEGSGDWDLSCADYTDDWAQTHICEDGPVVNSDNVAVRWDSSLVNGALGTDWSLSSRLPAGQQTVSFTVDDGVNPPSISSIEVDVSESAPVLVLTSPIPGIEVDSDGPVLFDFRGSFDADGDDFWVNISSDLIEGLIVENGTTDYWYNDDLPSGVHNLTFNLTDSTGLTRIHNQILHVNPTAPHAIISSLSEGLYITPGESIVFDGSESWDADDDIIQYIWHEVTTSGSVEVANDVNFTAWFPPGQHTFTLTVRDSRGVMDMAWINITVGTSNPVLSQLTVNLVELEADVKNNLVVSVFLQDADGTTQMEGTVQGRVSFGSNNDEFTMYDDGAGSDEIAGDGIYTGTIVTNPGTEDWATVEVWALDGDLSSNVVKEQLGIHQASGISGIFDLLGSTGIVVLISIILILALIGLLYVFRNKRMLAADLELIDSWGGGIGSEQTFDLGEEETAPKIPDMEAEAPPAMSDFGEP